VPILAVLHDQLDAHVLGTGSDLVFGRKPDEPFNPKAIADPAKRAWAAVNEREQEEAEREGRNPDLLPSLTFHECRHTFASLLIDAGVNPKAIQEFMGHATMRRRSRGMGTSCQVLETKPAKWSTLTWTRHCRWLEQAWSIANQFRKPLDSLSGVEAVPLLRSNRRE
jgi:hypothetical protein